MTLLAWSVHWKRLGRVEISAMLRQGGAVTRERHFQIDILDCMLSSLVVKDVFVSKKTKHAVPSERQFRLNVAVSDVDCPLLCLEKPLPSPPLPSSAYATFFQGNKTYTSVPLLVPQNLACSRRTVTYVVPWNAELKEEGTFCSFSGYKWMKSNTLWALWQKLILRIFFSLRLLRKTFSFFCIVNGCQGERDSSPLLQVFFSYPRFENSGDCRARERERECIKVRILRRQFRHNFEPGWKILFALVCLFLVPLPTYTSGEGKYKQFNGRRRPPSLSQIVRQIKNLFFPLLFLMAMHFGGRRTVVRRKVKNAEMPTAKSHTWVHQCVSCLYR